MSTSVEQAFEDLQNDITSAESAITSKGGTIEHTGTMYLASNIASIPTGGGTVVQADYSQNDSTKSDYIKNRPFYEESGGSSTETITGTVNTSTQQSVTYYGTSNVIGYRVIDTIPWTYDTFVSSTFKSITIGGTEFTSDNFDIRTIHDYNSTVLGHSFNIKTTNEYNGCCVAIISYSSGVTYSNVQYFTNGGEWDGVVCNGAGIYIINGLIQATSIKFEITSSSGGTVHKIDKKFLPDDIIPAATWNKYTGMDVQVFSKGICIGDSITEGSINVTATTVSSYSDLPTPTSTGLLYYVSGETAYYESYKTADGYGWQQANVSNGLTSRGGIYSYPTQFEKYTGIPMYNAGIAGADAQAWYEAYSNSSSYWGKWDTNRWKWSSENTSLATVTNDLYGYDFAIIHLGINDFLDSNVRGGTVSQRVEAFVSNMKNIVNALPKRNQVDKLKVFICTIIPSYATDNTWDIINNAIKDLVTYFNTNSIVDAYLIDLTTYSEVNATGYTNGHLTPIGYRLLAREIANMISYTIHSNPSQFSKIGFISGYQNLETPTPSSIEKYNGGIQ